MPFRVFKILFPRSTRAMLHTEKWHKHIKIYNSSSIEGRCTVKIRQKYKCVKCRFYAVSGDGPVLLGMPDIKYLIMLKIPCNIIGRPHESRKSVWQTKGQVKCKQIKYIMSSVMFFIQWKAALKESPQYMSKKAVCHIRHPQRMLAYTLQEPLNGDLERLQRQQVIVLLALMRHLNGVTASF